MVEIGWTICKRPKNKHQAMLIKQVQKEFKLKVRLISYPPKRQGVDGFWLASEPNSIYLRRDLDDPDFHFTLFHEIRHVLQRRGKFYLMGDKKLKSSEDVIRYLFDFLNAEFDADAFAIRECAARALDVFVTRRKFYSSTSRRGLIRFVKQAITDIEMSGFNISDKLVEKIVDEACKVVSR